MNSTKGNTAVAMRLFLLIYGHLQLETSQGVDPVGGRSRFGPVPSVTSTDVCPQYLARGVCAWQQRGITARESGEAKEI